MKDLTEIRKDIDEIDSQIVALYQKRMHLTTQVAEYKIATGKEVFDREREQSKLKTLSEKVDTPFLQNGVKELFEQIMAMSRKKQYQLLSEYEKKNGKSHQSANQWIEQLPVKDKTVVFQGTPGAYSQMAMKEFFHDQCQNFQVETWRDAMNAIADGTADYAVFPIENSTAGIVSENYDLIAEYNHYIVGELVLKIDHALLGLKEAQLSDIRTVLSHPQALSQCSKYLEEHREWEKVSQKNTAASALKVKEDGDKTQAAIANILTAQIYDLQVLDTGIINVENNATRFIIVAKEPLYAKDADKISICFEIPHESGSLYHILSHFIYNNVNMTNIESRPIPDKSWEYRFFVDFDGNLEDSAVQNALRGLGEEVSSLKVLGNYKAAEK